MEITEWILHFDNWKTFTLGNWKLLLSFYKDTKLTNLDAWKKASVSQLGINSILQHEAIKVKNISELNCWPRHTNVCSEVFFTYGRVHGVYYFSSWRNQKESTSFSAGRWHFLARVKKNLCAKIIVQSLMDLKHFKVFPMIKEVLKKHLTQIF